MNRFLFVCFLLWGSCSCVKGQQFGAFPPSVKWQSINSDTASVIFESPVDSQARRIASIIQRIASYQPNSLGNKIRKINILLHSNTVLANGYVALAPFRSEYYLVPPGNIFETGGNPWEEELAVHEYRHVYQFSNFNNGLSKFASYILGQEGQALFNVLAIPDWFFEGDAVHAETALTLQGRGRTAFFFNGMNSLFREQRDYSWEKLRNGSLKDYVPDHYPLGYMLVNYGYLKYGNDFWGKVTRDASAFSPVIYPFQSAIKKYSGVDFKTFRTAALDFYSHEVSKRRSDVSAHKTVTNYYFPQQISPDSLLYLKDSYKTIPAFYIHDQSGEHKLVMKNIGSENWFSYRNGWIAYTAYNVNPRWNLIDYNNIWLHNIKTGEEKRITKNGKYYSPDISPSGTSIVAVSINASDETELQVLDMDGLITQRVKAKENAFFFQPRFVDESRVAVVERLPNSSIQLSLIDLSSGREQLLTPPVYATIGYPHVYKDTVYFVSSIGGNDDLYFVTLKDKRIYQLTPGISGRYFPSIYKDSVTFSRFTSYGLEMRQQSLSDLKKTEINKQSWKAPVIPYPIAGADTTKNVLGIPTRQFTELPYKQSTHLFNFHSWRPDYTDPEFTLSLFSDNILNNFSNEVFYRYNQNETSHALGFNSVYGGFYPGLTAGVTYTFDRTIKTIAKTYSLNEVEAKAGYYIPLNFTGGKMYKSLTFGSNFVFNHLTPTGFYKDSLQGRSTTYLQNFINWSEQLPKATQQIYPKFAYALSIYHQQLLNRNGFQFLGNARVYLPSIANHSIVLAASIQETDTSNIVFDNRFSNSRGYTDFYFAHMWKLSGNYHMPLVYPDWGFGNIVYFLRLRSNFFYDYTRVYSNDRTRWKNLQSTGAEIFFDSKWWNELPVTFGVRWSHLLDNDFNVRPKGSNVFEFVVPIDLVPSR
jgi:hypothetical protein